MPVLPASLNAGQTFTLKDRKDSKWQIAYQAVPTPRYPFAKTPKYVVQDASDLTLAEALRKTELFMTVMTAQGWEKLETLQVSEKGDAKFIFRRRETICGCERVEMRNVWLEKM